MKSAYVICILLSITISYLTLANADGVPPIQNGTHISNVTKDETTTALPSPTTSSTPGSSTSTTTASISSSTTSNVTTPTKQTTAVPPTTASSPTTKASPPTITTSKPTSAVPTTAKPSTVTSSTVTTSTVAPNSTPAEATTTAVPSPSKDRHFDGLSFFGGIILATCLMAIAVFSWKFYRQCNQENYRTL